MMDKKEVQQRVLKNGKPLDLDLFEWNEKTNTFSSLEDELVLDFKNISHCIFETGSYCTFETGHGCTFKTGSDCTFNAKFECIFNTKSNCIFSTKSHCTFKTGSHCTFNTSYTCTFKTGSHCTFNASFECFFSTKYNCIFNTKSNCIFKTGHCCTFKTGPDCVIIRRDKFEVIQPKEDKLIQLLPYCIKGYLVNGMLNGEPYITVDNILSKVINKKGNVYKVINYGENKESFIIKDGDIYSHGKTIKEARDSLIYKIINKDTSVYNNFTLKTKVTKEEAIKMYRSITGACESGTRYFVEQNRDKLKDKFSIKEIIALTKYQFGNTEFKEFFKR